MPQGWWHYEIATADNTHLLAIFDAPTPEVILGSDILKFTPANVMAHTYCLDENQWKKTIAPVVPSTYIGPANNCNRNNQNQTSTNPPNSYVNAYQQPMNPYHYQYPYSYPYGSY